MDTTGWNLQGCKVGTVVWSDLICTGRFQMSRGRGRMDPAGSQGRDRKLKCPHFRWTVLDRAGVAGTLKGCEAET
jgi:hypothetical protein